MSRVESVRTPPRRARAAAMTMALSMLTLGFARAADLPADAGMASVVLPTPPSKHWVWVNDMVFAHMTDGEAHLIDGDTGRYLGTLSVGNSAMRVVLPRDGRVIYSPEIYFSRGTRGTRTDVVTIYDAATLAPSAEIPIPPRRSSNSPTMGNAVLTDDDRFLLIYNFNPGQSVSVVDTRSRKFVGEIETAGCALIYPTGNRSFFTICADGGLIDVGLTEQGGVAYKRRIAPIIDVAHDPVTEKGVRDGADWLFATFDGDVYVLHATANGVTGARQWSLTSAEQRAQGWRPGGVQHLALHVGRRELYSLMHQGGRETHKDPGSQIWVYDLRSRQRVRVIETKNPSTSIVLSSDDQPLLFSAFADAPKLDIYDPVSGKLLRSVDDVATTPTLLITP